MSNVDLVQQRNQSWQLLPVRPGWLAPGMMRCLRVLGALTVVVLSVACQNSAEGARFSGPYAAEFQNAYDGAEDPGVKKILEDGVVSWSEYEEIHQQILSCAKDQGLILSLEKRGELYSYSFTSTPDSDSILASCEGAFIDTLALYASTVTNPNNEDVAQLIVDCLKRRGLVGDDYTPEQMKSDMDARTEPFATGEGDAHDLLPEARECFEDPRKG